MNDDITAIETAQENAEHCADFIELLKKVRDTGLVYWEPNTSRGDERRDDMIRRIDQICTPGADEAVEEVTDAETLTEAASEMLREVRDTGLIYWEPNTDRGRVAQQAMVNEITDLIGDRHYLDDPAPAGSRL